MRFRMCFTVCVPDRPPLGLKSRTEVGASSCFLDRTLIFYGRAFADKKFPLALFGSAPLWRSELLRMITFTPPCLRSGSLTTEQPELVHLCIDGGGFSVVTYNPLA